MTSTRNDDLMTLSGLSQRGQPRVFVSRFVGWPSTRPGPAATASTMSTSSPRWGNKGGGGEVLYLMDVDDAMSVASSNIATAATRAPNTASS